jgi:hypothetical protein
MEATKNYTLTETAKEIRNALKTAFPGTKFSVRSKRYSGGRSITASWIDGPAASQVDPILKQYEGATFDGMIDLKSYKDPSEYKGEIVHFAPDFVFSDRSISHEAMTVISFHVCKRVGELPNSVEVKNHGGSGYVEAAYRPMNFELRRLYDNDGRALSTVLANIAEGPQQPEALNQLIHQVAYATSWEGSKV